MACTELGVQTITVMTCTQILKTAFIENVLGYYVHLDPCPMLLLQPKDDAAAAFSKERLVPMVEATPVLRALISDHRTRRSDDTIGFKRFPGGLLAISSAGSPTNLAMRSIRVTLLDEIDKYEPTKEGDPVSLAEERTATFPHNRLSIRACSPTLEETSRISRSYLSSDQRRAYVPCPHCDGDMVLDFFRHVHWQKNEDEGEHFAATAALYCEHCGTAWNEADRLRALQKTTWKQTKIFMCCGERQNPILEKRWRYDEKNQVHKAICKHCEKETIPNRHAGFTCNKLYSPFITVVELVEKWLLAKDDYESKQTFYNTQLGLPFRLDVQKDVKPDVLAARRENYEHEVPKGVLVLTAGIDSQAGSASTLGRLEVEVVGWGKGEESWSLGHEVFNGDPAAPKVWQELDEYLQKRWKRADGNMMVVKAACIDTGGYNTQEAYNFARKRIGRNIWAIKGASDRAQWSPIWPAREKTRKYRTGFRPVIIGVNAGKEAVRQRLLVESVGAGYCHFPTGRAEGWFHQLTAEKLVIERKAGTSIRKWVLPGGRANEALDCRVYAYAALWGLYHVRKVSLEKLEASIESIVGFQAIPVENPVVSGNPPPDEPEQQNYIPVKPKYVPRPAYGGGRRYRGRSQYMQ